MGIASFNSQLNTKVKRAIKNGTGKLKNKSVNQSDTGILRERER